MEIHEKQAVSPSRYPLLLHSGRPRKQGGGILLQTAPITAARK